MTRTEVGAVINIIIGDTVQAGAKHSYAREVERIFEIMGKLTPEPTEKPTVPAYNLKKVKRVGTLVQRSQFTQEQRDAAVAALRAVGLL
jgi:hypothetical protein